MLKRARKLIPEIPKELIKAVAENRSVLFAGAGISRVGITGKSDRISKGLPGWRELLLALISHAGYLHASESNELKQAVEDQKFLFVAQEIREKMQGQLYNILESILNDSSVRPNARHKLIAEIPFSAIITTNYDKLLEETFTERRERINTYAPDQAPKIINALVDGKRFILKAHGDINRPDTIVLSESDY